MYRITIITCQARPEITFPFAMDISGLVCNDARPYLWGSAGVQPMSFPDYQITSPTISSWHYLVRSCHWLLQSREGVWSPIIYWKRLKAISWRFCVHRSVYLWDCGCLPRWESLRKLLQLITGWNININAVSHSSRQFWWGHCTNFIRPWSLWYVQQYNGRNRE